VGVLEHVEVDPSLLKETRHVCHRFSFPSQSSLVSIARASQARQRPGLASKIRLSYGLCPPLCGVFPPLLS
jgi:hypothetical protein